MGVKSADSSYIRSGSGKGSGSGSSESRTEQSRKNHPFATGGKVVCEGECEGACECEIKAGDPGSGYSLPTYIPEDGGRGGRRFVDAAVQVFRSGNCRCRSGWMDGWRAAAVA